MRPIDADALSKRMYYDAFETDSDMQKWDSGCWIRYKMFENAIEDAPTIESERKKGKWLSPSRNPEYVNREFFSDCSECGFTTMDETKYCPNCGADMRGEQE